jgi:hypothetical protein
MQFHDEEIEKLKLESVVDFNKLITVYLCGRRQECQLNKQEESMVKAALDNIRKNKMSFEQLNEVLLLMNQSRIGLDFFIYFSKNDCVTLQELKECVVQFRGYAMLRFGNFRFAFKELLSKDEIEIGEILEPFSENSDDAEPFFTQRPAKILDISSIERDLISYIGELSGRILGKEEEFWIKEAEKAKQNNDKKKFRELLSIKRQLNTRKNAIAKVEKQAIANSDVYLTWDCMDVYIATSMRNKWEYEETYDFIRSVFSDAKLQSLKLRYFDPTQSKCGNARDKGLIEGLMLKRSLCAIYMAQEGDTMGKDSELAATLSQSKPVIAYVPEYDRKEFASKIANYQLDYFRTRLKILDVEGTLNECEEELSKVDKKYQKLIDVFLEKLDQFKRIEPYTLLKTEQKFKSQYQDFSKICEIISIAQCHSFNNRVKSLTGAHPLCMQVDWRSGVTNGILVVRKPSDCAHLLYRLLTNRMNFAIKRAIGCTILEEEISQCAYRVITDNEKLTNCFWNYFGKT